MTTLLLALAGLAVLDSLNVLSIGIVSAIIYGSRLNRQSPLPGGTSYLAGVFMATTLFGLCAVVGLRLLGDLTNFNLTPTARYWGEFVLGAALIVLAFVPLTSRVAAPSWIRAAMRQRPWLLGFVGAAVGLGQASTSVPYLTGLAMIAAAQPRPTTWPIMVIAYWVLALLPCMLVLGLSASRSKRADRAQRRLVRAVTQYGPVGVRILFLIAGGALFLDAVVHHGRWW
ncbi:GAP family protein [Mycolicibacter icosiumassiliensis]|uniref:GAP family protein n=1 Tax=Mycolicibacter icosiumassiliensis TaxID=1792835 RepID=UPI00082A6F80|nr:GAP family protein [Mycolicibacter icosiumassiliensis]